MFSRISLRSRLFILITALALINLSSSLLTIWYSYRTQNLQASMIDKDLSALMAAQKLETTLVMQKGLLTYYFLTSSPKWLEQLNKHKQDFNHWLGKARDVNMIHEARPIINEIESRYIRYTFERDKVIKLYMEGKQKEGTSKHWNVRDQFYAIYNLAEQFKQLQEKSIEKQRLSLKKSGRTITLLAGGVIVSVLILNLILAFTILKQVLGPIRELVLKTDQNKSPAQIGNEVNLLKHMVNDLVFGIDQARLNLEQSHEHLIQSEKLAMVGKLAAGMAHSVRNPLTSVKMRLFSLGRSLQLNPIQKDDMEVISEEIRHIDTILRNFLEFARPPKLRLKMVSLSDVVDMTIQLLKHRFETYRTNVQVKRDERLHEIPADADQLKEVLVNILINACEAMGENGTIRILEKAEEIVPYGQVVSIDVEDNGPGIPSEILDKVFQPFCSGKEKGSGLGLSIAKRIIEDHNGKLSVISQEGQGTTFTIVLPCKEKIDGEYFNRG